MLSTFTRPVTSIGVRPSPTPRNTPPSSVITASVVTVPSVIWLYSTAMRLASLPSPNHEMTGPLPAMPRTARGALTRMDHSSAWRASTATRCASRAPYACATSTAAPPDSGVSTAMITGMTNRAVPTPASAAAPSPATRMVSTTPSSVWSRFSPMTGMARRRTRRRGEVLPVTDAGGPVWSDMHASVRLDRRPV